MSAQNPSISRQHLDDYVSGKLDAANVERVEAFLASNPDVATQVQQDQAIRARIRDMFAPVLLEPIPERLIKILASGRFKALRSGTDEM